MLRNLTALSDAVSLAGVHRACLMQGTGRLEEDFAAPPHLCPVDLAKLQACTGCELLPRYLALLAFCEGQPSPFDEQAAWLRQAIRALRAANNVTVAAHTTSGSLCEPSFPAQEAEEELSTKEAEEKKELVLRSEAELEKALKLLLSCAARCRAAAPSLLEPAATCCPRRAARGVPPAT